MPVKTTISAKAQLENFFGRYTPQQAQVLLWKWFILSFKGGISRLSSEEAEKYVEFFDMLQDIILSLSEKEAGEDKNHG